MNGDANDPHRYDDIIDLPHPVSETHPPMTLRNRAAQFSPFAALVGYEAAIQETARLTDQRMELDDDTKLIISAKLQLIQDHSMQHPAAAVTFFQPDEKKHGGAYRVEIGSIKKVDAYERVVVMASGGIIPIDEIIHIDGELFRGMDEHFA